MLRILNTSFLLIAVVFALPLSGLSQTDSCKSVSLGEGNVPRCASVFVEFRDITARRIKGRIESGLDSPILIEIYKLEKKERKLDSYAITGLKDPILTIETNTNGDFCHPGLTDGYYLLRFGTEDGGFNCTWIKVRISKQSVDRKIKVDLSIGI